MQGMKVVVRNTGEEAVVVLQRVLVDEKERVVVLTSGGRFEAYRPEQLIPSDAEQHRYDCRCELCLLWWASGPDTGDYGPFTREEVAKARRAMGER